MLRVIFFLSLLAARAMILDRGRIVYEGRSPPLLHDPHRLAELIGVGG